ncbi:MAG: radical SAM family heme chaperone HemW [Bacteroidales bacterium]|nr:radical SAM family heme chaperone HemW [Bacteroidales bacterium]
MAGIYIHIPFCRSRCAYCDFYSTTCEQEAASYVAALCREMTKRCLEIPRAHIRTLYIGGGTPSVLSPNLLREILDHTYALFDIDRHAEVTIEMNPDDHLNFSLLPQVNRVSLGIQTFDERLLKLIRRRHDAGTAIRTVRDLQSQGIRNISCDLIYGLPTQTIEKWERDLDIVFNLDIQHLSAYALSYETGTTITRWRDEGRLEETSEELSAAMYRRLCQRAREAGFEHYEISNFARPDYYSRHNSSYWTGAPYLGFGPGAHSYDGQCTRRANTPDLTRYLQYWNEDSRPLVDKLTSKQVDELGPVVDKLTSKQVDELGPVVDEVGLTTIKPVEESEGIFRLEHLTPNERYNELVMCSLRTSQGIDLHTVQQQFGEKQLNDLMSMARPHIHAQRLICANGKMRLSEQAIMTSDDIMSDLMIIE